MYVCFDGYYTVYFGCFQINLLRILAILGRGDQASSEGMYEVLSDAMKRADTGINVGYAIGIMHCSKHYYKDYFFKQVYENPFLNNSV